MVRCNALKALEAAEGAFANVTYNLRKISENVSLKRDDFYLCFMMLHTKVYLGTLGFLN